MAIILKDFEGFLLLFMAASSLKNAPSLLLQVKTKRKNANEMKSNE